MRKEPGPAAPEDLIEEAAGADYALARRRVRSIVGGPALDRFLRQVRDYRNRTYPPETKRVHRVRMKDEDKARIGHLFVAALDDPARSVLPSPPGLDSERTPVVRLSPETAVKQVINHWDLTTADYRQIPDIIEHGDPFLGPRAIVFFQVIDDDYAYKAVIKPARDANEVFLVSFHKIRRAKDLPREKRGLTKVSDSTGR